MLWNVVLSPTSIFGTTYDAKPRAWVRNGLSTLQYGFVVAVSGNFALTSHESVDVRPVLVPPCSVRLCRMRAVKFTSTPFQCCFCRTATLSDRLTRLLVRPDCEGSTL